MERHAWDSIIQEVKEARDFSQLRALRDRAHDVFLLHLPSEEPFEWNGGVNRLHDTIIYRTIEMTERILCEERNEQVPLPYAFFAIRQRRTSRTNIVERPGQRSDLRRSGG